MRKILLFASAVLYTLLLQAQQSGFRTNSGYFDFNSSGSASQQPSADAGRVNFMMMTATAPALFNVNGGGTACGTDGVSVGLSGSESGVSYQLYKDGSTAVGATLSGTGSALNFGLFTAAGNYTVVATETSSGLTANMNNSATILSGNKPVISYVLSQPNNCNSNNGGAALTITGSAGPYTFLWTGAGIIQGVQDQSTLRVGPYSVQVTSADGCQETAYFGLYGPGGCDVCPTIGSLTSSSPACAGTSFTLSAAGLTDMGSNYGIAFRYSVTALANPYSGGTLLATVTNGSLTSGGTVASASASIPTAGSYYVYAVLSPAPFDPACRPYLLKSVSIGETPSASVTPATQTICSGTAITDIVPSSTSSGVTYSWTRNNAATVTGIAASGTGSISGTLTNTSASPVTVSFSVTPVKQGSDEYLYSTDNNGSDLIKINSITGAVTAIGSFGYSSTWALAFKPDGTAWTVINGFGAAQLASVNLITGAATPVGAPLGFQAICLESNSAGELFTVDYSNGDLYKVNATTGATTFIGSSGLLFTMDIAFDAANKLWAINTSSTLFSINTTSGALTVEATLSGGVFGEMGLAINGSGVFYLTEYTSSPRLFNLDPATGVATLVNSFTGMMPHGGDFNPASSTCTGTPVTATVVVNPIPNVTATPASQTVCSGAAITTIALSSGVSGTTYSWTRDNTAAVTGLASSGTGNISGTLTNTTNAPVTVTFTITPSANGCTGTPVTATTVVNPIATGTAAPATQTICSATAITNITFSGPVSGTTYAWTRDNTTAVTGIAASGTGNISGTLTNTTNAPVTVTFTITPTANGCAGTTFTATVIVNPTPGATATPSTQTICTGTAMTPIVFTGAVSGTTYNWVRTNTTNVTGIPVAGTGTISGTVTNTTTSQQTVTFTITPVANGCNGTPITATLIVNAAPLITCPANITVNNGTGICGAVVSYPAAVATGTPAPTVTYSIASGSTFPVGTTTVTATATNACGTATCTFTVTVVDVQAPVITCPGNIAATAVGACTAVVNYTVTATDNCPGVTVTRTAGPASGSAFPIGVTTITHLARDAAGNTSTCSFTVTVTDGQLPVITTQPVTRTVCSGTNAVFSVTATNALSYQWQNWNGSSWTNITGATTSSYTISNVNSGMNTNTYRVIVNGLCNTATSNAASLYVNGLPLITLSATGTTQLLPGNSVTLNSQVNPAGGNYVWYLNGAVLNGNNNSSLTGVSVDQIGTYKVAYTDPNGCTNTSADLTISGMPSMNIYVAPNPSNGQFTVRVYSGVNEELTMRIYDAKGALVYNRKVAPAAPYSSIQVDLQAMGIPPAGIYHLVLFNKEGKRIGTKQLVVYR